MNGIQLVLRALHHGERQLAADLAAAADRHSAEHEVRHVATDLAVWSREHSQRLAEAAVPYDLHLDGRHSEETSSGPAPRGAAEATLLPRSEPGFLLLEDLRALHLGAVGNSLSWEMLAQAGQATKDACLLDLAASCHPRTLRQMRWTNTMIKNLSPQVITSL